MGGRDLSPSKETRFERHSHATVSWYRVALCWHPVYSAFVVSVLQCWNGTVSCRSDGPPPRCREASALGTLPENREPIRVVYGVPACQYTG